MRTGSVFFFKFQRAVDFRAEIERTGQVFDNRILQGAI